MLVPLVSHPNYSYLFPARHRFPMEKFGLLLTYLQTRNIATNKNLFRPGKIKKSLLELSHCPKYIQRFTDNALSPHELKALGLPWSTGLLERTLISPNGTLLTALLALQHGIACHLAGGTHHAHFNHASGFCIFNDLAVTARALLRLGKVSRILVFDCDVHQGDGTAAILSDEPNAITVSIHCENNFPSNKQFSNLDVSLSRGVGDSEYLNTVGDTLDKVVQLYQPELILYDAGVDIYQHDPLGRLNISLNAIYQRDYFVLSYCRDRSIPVATVIGGGYDDDRLALAKRHALVTEAAQTICQKAV